MTETLDTMLTRRLHKTVRPLTHSDEEAIYDLQKSNQAFYDLFLDHHLTRREAVNDLDEVPMQSAAGAKHYLGIFDGLQLVATLDLVVDYPLPQVTWVGQFMWHQDLVSSETAVQWVAASLDTLRDIEAVQVQLLLLEQDKPGQKFWSALGFQPVQRTQIELFGHTVSGQVYLYDLVE